MQVRIIAAQLLQIIRRRAAPTVNRLIVVADRSERRAHPGEFLQQVILRSIGILIFIHQHMPQTILPFLAHFGMRLQQLGGQSD